MKQLRTYCLSLSLEDFFFAQSFSNPRFPFIYQYLKYENSFLFSEFRNLAWGLGEGGRCLRVAFENLPALYPSAVAESLVWTWSCPFLQSLLWMAALIDAFS